MFGANSSKARYVSNTTVFDFHLHVGAVVSLNKQQETWQK